MPLHHGASLAALAVPPRGAESDHGLTLAALPKAISSAGPRAVFHSVAFFTSRIPNTHTRAAYGRAVAEFCGWLEAHEISLLALSSPFVALYYQELLERLSPASASLHLTGIRQWLEWLTRSGVLPVNPASPVRRLRLSRQEG
jgi:site-specific recombinase XerD